jgi:hypothetical protein
MCLCVFTKPGTAWTPFQVDRPGLGHSNSVHNTYTNGLPWDLACLALLRPGLFSDALWSISILPGASFGSKQDLLLPPRLLNTTDPSFHFPFGTCYSRHRPSPGFGNQEFYSEPGHVSNVLSKVKPLRQQSPQCLICQLSVFH